MPAESRAQRRFMAMCEHHPEHARGECPDMTEEQLHEFAATKEGGLPEHVKSLVERLQALAKGSPGAPKIVKSAIGWLVDRYHVGTPHETIEADIRKRAQKGLKAGTIKPEHVEAWVKEARDRHDSNRSLYSYVMGGFKAPAKPGRGFTPSFTIAGDTRKADTMLDQLTTKADGEMRWPTQTEVPTLEHLYTRYGTRSMKTTGDGLVAFRHRPSGQWHYWRYSGGKYRMTGSTEQYQKAEESTTKEKSMSLFDRLVQKAVTLGTGLPPLRRTGAPRRQSSADYWRNAFKGEPIGPHEIEKSISKKHFQAIADAFVNAHESAGPEHEAGVSHAMSHVVHALRGMNPRFDESRFRDWVGAKRAARRAQKSERPDPVNKGEPLRATCVGCGKRPGVTVRGGDWLCPGCAAKKSETARGTAMRSDPGEQLDPIKKAKTCSLCGGEKMLLGKLGQVSHYRCRNCGMMFAHEPRGGAKPRGTAARKPVPQDEPVQEKSLRRLRAAAGGP